MKRLICLAETNHYALYNAFNFLSKCETPKRVLLSSVVNALAETAREDTKAVLSILVNFVKLHLSDTQN